jgi:hypothetical protein
MEGKKTRALEHHKVVAPKLKSVQKRGRPRDPIKAWLPANCPPPFSVGRFAKVCCILIMGLGSAAHPGYGVCGGEIFSTFHKMRNAFIRRIIGVLAMACVVVLQATAQQNRGELRLEVRDPQGAALVAQGELVSVGNQFQLDFHVGEDGRYVAQGLAFGVYRVSLTHGGFVPSTQLVEIRSMVPQQLSVTLGLTLIETQVEVDDAGTLVDPSRTGTVYTIGSQSIGELASPQPGRGILSVVDAQPGWLYEANGVLHPRGSEYDVQFVVDGLPLTENHSPAFAPPFESGDMESMRVMTADFPAEYGRKLGGVVEITSPKNAPVGLHGEFDAEGGSFSSGSAHSAIFYPNGANRFSVSGDGFHTDRYLDPPVLSNYTNRGNAGGFSASYERDFSTSDRLLVTMTQHAVRYLAPNELIQQQAGQREDAAQQETSGQARYTHTFSPDLLSSVAGSVRDASALLSSNALSTPIVVSQDRGTAKGTCARTSRAITGVMTGRSARTEFSASCMKCCSIALPIRPNLIPELN